MKPKVFQRKINIYYLIDCSHSHNICNNNNYYNEFSNDVVLTIDRHR